MGIISISNGNFHLGRRQVNRDGQTVSETPPRWENDPQGACVAETVGWL